MQAEPHASSWKSTPPQTCTGVGWRPWTSAPWASSPAEHICPVAGVFSCLRMCPLPVCLRQLPEVATTLPHYLHTLLPGPAPRQGPRGAMDLQRGPTTPARLSGLPSQEARALAPTMASTEHLPRVGGRGEMRPSAGCHLPSAGALLVYSTSSSFLAPHETGEKGVRPIPRRWASSGKSAQTPVLLKPKMRCEGRTRVPVRKRPRAGRREQPSPAGSLGLLGQVCASSLRFQIFLWVQLKTLQSPLATQVAELCGGSED